MITTGAHGTGNASGDPPLLRVVPPYDPIQELTPRERQVLDLVARGYSNGAIRGELHIAAGTLERHIRNIFLKLNLVGEEGSNARVRATLMWLDSPHSRSR